MAQIVLGAVGAVVGGYFGGPQGAALGWSIGAGIGGVIGQEGVHTRGPRLDDLKVQASTYGGMIPIVYGTMRVAGNVIACSDIRTVENVQEQGKGGASSSSTTYTYNVDIAIALCNNEIAGLRKIYDRGKLTYDVSAGSSVGSTLASTANAATLKIYYGTEDQLPDPTLEALFGVGNVPAYRGRAYVVFTQMDCPNGQIPQLTFEVMTEATRVTVVSDFSRIESPTDTVGGRSAAVVKDGVAYHINQGVKFFDPDYALQIYKLGANYQTRLADIQIGQISGVSVVGVTSPTPEAEVFYATSAGPVFQFNVVDIESGVRKNIYSGPAPRLGSTWFGSSSMAAYDSISNKYACAKYHNAALGSVLIISRGGIREITGVSAQLQNIAIYNNRLYVLSTDQAGPFDFGLSRLTIFDADTGAIISSVTGATSDKGSTGTGNYQYVFASPTGVFVQLEEAAGRNVYRVDASYHLVGETGSSGRGGGIDPGGFFANNDHMLVGPGERVSGFVTYKFASFSRLDPVAPALASVLTEIAGQAGLLSENLDVSTVGGVIDGYALTNVSSARSNIEPILKAFLLDVTESDLKVKIRPRATLTPVATIPYDELGAVEAGSDPADPLALQRTQEDELPRSIAVTYLNVDADYQQGTETSRRIITNSINDLVDQIAIAMDSTRAATVADALLYDAWSARNGWAMQTPRRYAYLDAGDVVQVEYPRGTISPKRLARANDDSVICKFDLVAHDGEIYTVIGTGATPPNQQPGPELLSPTRTEPLDIPLLRDDDNSPGLYVALGGLAENWPGATLYIGIDDPSLTPRGAVSHGTPMGRAVTLLAPWLRGEMDETNTVIVTIGPGDLNSATRDEVLDQAANVALLGEEIIQFDRAEYLGDNQYRLSGLLRGQRGTERAEGSHRVSERFVLLQFAGLLRPAYDLSELNSPRQFRGVTLGAPLSSQASQTVVNTGEVLRPFAPVNLRRSNTGNDINLTWDRRSRLSQNLALGTIPLGEASEAWRVEFYTSSAFTTLAGVLSPTTAAVTLTASQQIAWGLTPGGVAHVRVAQMSESVGAGHTLQGNL